MAEQKETVFSRQSIKAKQELAREDYEKKVTEMRQTFESVGKTPEGEKLFRFLFILCGGDSSSIRRDKDGDINMDDTLLTLGVREVYQNLRFHMTSDMIKKIERRDWEH